MDKIKIIKHVKKYNKIKIKSENRFGLLFHC